jgi:hypothetical protein
MNMDQREFQMSAQRLAAILLIFACAAVLFSTVINAPGLYATQDIDERLQIIETYRTRWLINQAFVFLFGILSVGGFGVLASGLRTKGKSWLPILGAGAIVAGTISGLTFAYLQTTDPRSAYAGGYQTAEDVAYWLWLAGTVLFGVSFLQAGLPSWLGYLTAGASLLYGIALLLTGAGFMTPFLLALLSLLIGIVLLRQ